MTLTAVSQTQTSTKAIEKAPRLYERRKSNQDINQAREDATQLFDQELHTFNLQHNNSSGNPLHSKSTSSLSTAAMPIDLVELLYPFSLLT